MPVFLGERTKKRGENFGLTGFSLHEIAGFDHLV